MQCAPEPAAHRGDVVVVAPPPDGDVPLGWHLVVRRVEVEPPDRGSGPHGAPRVRRVDADELRAARRRQRLDVAAHVPGGQADGAQRGDGDVGEVLAHAVTTGEHVGERRRQVGGLRVEAELAIDRVAERARGIDDAAPGCEHGLGERAQPFEPRRLRGVCEIGVDGDEHVVERADGLGDDGLPRHVDGGGRGHRHVDLDRRDDRQRRVRVVDGEVHDAVAERIDRLLPLVGRRADVEFRREQVLAGHLAGLHPGDGEPI